MVGKIKATGHEKEREQERINSLIVNAVMKSKSQIEKQVVKSYSDKEDGVLKLLLFWFSLDVLSSVNMN